MPLTVIREDITKMKVDAVVNAANNHLSMGGGVCGAIFRAAGADSLRAACARLAPIKTGEAVITEGFNLPARYIIHTVGPVYRGGGPAEAAQLGSCYISSLALAVEYECESVAFPLISSGLYGYPRQEALRIAAGAIRGFIGNNDIDVFLVMYDAEAFEAGKAIVDAAQSRVDVNYADAVDEQVTQGSNGAHHRKQKDA